MMQDKSWSIFCVQAGRISYLSENHKIEPRSTKLLSVRDFPHYVMFRTLSQLPSNKPRVLIPTLLLQRSLLNS